MTDEQKKLVEQNIGLVYYLASKYFLYDREYISIGMIGLIRGVQSFDQNKNIKLSTLLCTCIKNEMFTALKKNKQIQNTVLYVDDEVMTTTFLNNTPEEILMTKESNKYLYKNIKMLRKNEQIFLIHYYGLCGQLQLNQQELAKQYNVSRSYVCAVIKRAKNKLKKLMEDKNET